MAEELHKKVAIVVLLFVIILSALGTWTILETTSNRKPTIYENPVTTGKISVTILPPEKTQDTTGEEQT